MPSLVSIDPGRITGIARFVDSELVWAEVVKKPIEMPRDAYPPADKVVVELPELYPYSPVKPESMIRLAFIAGYLVGQFETGSIKTVYPKQWKGQRPKEVDNPYTMKLLSDQERRIVLATTSAKTHLHNVIDAVGIGLWALGRR